MKNILYVIGFLVLLSALLPSCNKNNEDEVNDYLPLKVGTKYKYHYSEFYRSINGGYVNYGECSWKFISMSVDMPFVYQVEQSLTGYSVSESDFWNGYQNIVRKDSTRIENQISTLSFKVLNNGKVAFSWPYGKVTFERFIQSDKIDTCYILERIPNRGCLRKNVGITSISYFTMLGNHQAGSGYSLIEGPTY